MAGKTSHVPQHVAIIPDGNRRWARAKGMAATAGHVRAGAYENINSLMKEAKNLGVKYLSLWGFSTENWKREKKEVDEILRVVSKGVDRCLEEAKKEKFGFKHIGRKDRLPAELLDKLKKLEDETKEFKESCVLLCLDYGGRDEIVRAVNKIIKEAKGDIEESTFANYLETAGIPDVDLIVRTGGEKRLSGFMPFQSDYAEIYFTDVLFPDFNAKELKKSVDWFMKVDRRFGN
ncbi:MAG: di-trans,poly-cis-decaprenylcistransferase [Nanoarchaeota archaeon]|nr:di-trans,poly-cis-decaprenylcistransferase [Nanoarchaeota archaeon]MBU1103831.1 di-trans,poly-cis-decaprenylcistransferase [Nanoarchaeota archaeon]